MILIGGANVYPAEVESALDEHPQVTSSCVIGLPDDEYGNSVRAIVQTVEPITSTELDEFLRSRLAKYKVRGDDGRVRRSALRAARVTTRTP
jgi:bile acid-coenzyme A ligase